MAYDDPNIQHKGAVQQLLDARQKASTAVSEARKYSVSTVDPHLAAVNGGEDSALAIECSQAVTDYLLELRPYRYQSSNWDIDLGDIMLPTSIDVPKSRRRGGESRRNTLWLCRQPHIPLTGLSRIIEITNMTVVYSTNKGSVEWSTLDNDNTTLKIDTDQYGTLVVEEEDVYKQVWRGAKPIDEAVSHPSVRQQKPTETEQPNKTEQESYRPAGPPDHGHEGREYQFVFPDNELLRVFEAAEQVAGDVDMLAEIELPDHNSTGSGAV